MYLLPLVGFVPFSSFFLPFWRYFSYALLFFLIFENLFPPIFEQNTLKFKMVIIKTDFESEILAIFLILLSFSGLVYRGEQSTKIVANLNLTHYKKYDYRDPTLLREFFPQKKSMKLYIWPLQYFSKVENYKFSSPSYLLIFPLYTC